MFNVTITIKAEAVSAKSMKKRVTKAIKNLFEGELKSSASNNSGIIIDMAVTGQRSTKEEKAEYKEAKKAAKKAAKKVKKEKKSA